ncbi:unnamed protein product [Phyllotreta striolata]|uniref:Protein sleepless n=1 Tax=Phyllotreta striolata TaxID=444603 RepID=A0A9N9TLN6_PHYSR|nr:unnamed protein product [Phyllotreta striolata]
MSEGYYFNLISAVMCFVLLQSIPNAEATIRCYKCLATLPTFYTNETIRLCKDFDYSDKFIVDCPYSTYCTKKFTTANIPTTINGTERDCASQKQVIQNYKNGRWQQEVEIEEPYQPGCHKVDDKGTRTSTIENCYCNYDLCNSATTATTGFLTALFTTVIVYAIV